MKDLESIPIQHFKESIAVIYTCVLLTFAADLFLLVGIPLQSIYGPPLILKLHFSMFIPDSTRLTYCGIWDEHGKFHLVDTPVYACLGPPDVGALQHPGY